MRWHFFTFKKGSSNKNQPKTQSGFGLIELLISISVMTIVSAIIMSRQDSFNGSLLLRNEAYDIALTIRQVQLSAVSASNDSGLSSGFRDVRGVHFSTADSSNDGFTIFAESTPYNGWPSAAEEYGVQGVLDKRFVIRNIRAIRSSGTTIETDISIVFARPNFDAHFFTDSASGEQDNIATVEIDIGRVGVTGPGAGVLRTFEVTSTGQIAVH